MLEFSKVLVKDLWKNDSSWVLGELAQIYEGLMDKMIEPHLLSDGMFFDIPECTWIEHMLGSSLMASLRADSDRFTWLAGFWCWIKILRTACLEKQNKTKQMKEQRKSLSGCWLRTSGVIHENYDNTMSADGVIQLNEKLSTGRTCAYHNHPYMLVHTWGSHIINTLTYNAWLCNVNVIKPQ